MSKFTKELCLVFQIPDIRSFTMMADNVEDLRVLAEKFAEQPEPTPPIGTRAKKAKVFLNSHYVSLCLVMQH